MVDPRLTVRFLLQEDSQTGGATTANTDTSLGASEEVTCVPRFLKLPFRARKIIYEYALNHDMIQLYPNKGYVIKRASSKPLNPNLLLASKAIYTEAGPFLYKNLFEMWDMETLFLFLSRLSASPKSWIEHLTVKDYVLRDSDDKSAFSALIGTSGLKTLTLLGSLQQGLPERVARNIHNNAKTWLEEVGIQKGDKKAGAELISVTRSAWPPLWTKRWGDELAPAAAQGLAVARQRHLEEGRHIDEKLRDALRQLLLGMPAESVMN